MLFLSVLKCKLSEKKLSSVKTKTNPNFAVKRAGRSNHSFFTESHHSNICILNT